MKDVENYWMAKSLAIQDLAKIANEKGGITVDHPTITEIERTGYPKEMLEQSDYEGIDYFGDEILTGDKTFIHEGETVLEENLERYLVEELDFEIREAK